jgi:cysteine-rich repeat protein
MALSRTVILLTLLLSLTPPCLPLCPDPSVDTFERCDDNNHQDRDGCENCEITDGWACPLDNSPCLPAGNRNSSASLTVRKVFAGWTITCVITDSPVAGEVICWGTLLVFLFFSFLFFSFFFFFQSIFYI